MRLANPGSPTTVVQYLIKSNITNEYYSCILLNDISNTETITRFMLLTTDDDIDCKQS